MYSPAAGTPYGTVDGVAYACGGHRGALLAMLADAGLSGHVGPDPNAARDMGRPCGHLFRYDALVSPTDDGGTPTAAIEDRAAALKAAFVARVPEPGPVQHPRWCTRAGSAPMHHSIAFKVSDLVSVQIHQEYNPPAPVIALILGTERRSVVFPLDKAVSLSRQLAAAVRLAGAR